MSVGGNLMDMVVVAVLLSSSPSFTTTVIILSSLIGLIDAFSYSICSIAAS